jgi:secreted trypsin-like serine protease
LILFSVSGALACAPPEPPFESYRDEQITNGEYDNNDPAVVALLKGNQIYCTGTLISPHVVLTAAHCLYNTRPSSVYFGTALSSGGVVIPVLESATHPGFDSSTLANDIGLIRLETEAPAVPASMLTDESAGPFDGMLVRVVGFGLDAGLGGTGSLKRTGSSLVAKTDATTWVIHPDPSQPCMGDSGGPILVEVDGAEYVAGVVSSGDIMCSHFANTNLVAYAMTDFIQPYLQHAESLDSRGAVSGGCHLAPTGGSLGDGHTVLLLAFAFLAGARPSNHRGRGSAEIADASSQISA